VSCSKTGCNSHFHLKDVLLTASLSSREAVGKEDCETVLWSCLQIQSQFLADSVANVRAVLFIDEESWIIHKHANHWINFIHMVLWLNLKESSEGIIIHISNLACERRRTVAMSPHSTSLELCGRGMLWVAYHCFPHSDFGKNSRGLLWRGQWRMNIDGFKFSLTIQLLWYEFDAGIRGFSLHH